MDTVKNIIKIIKQKFLHQETQLFFTADVPKNIRNIFLDFFKSAVQEIIC
jgi:hypothetical protein